MHKLFSQMGTIRKSPTLKYGIQQLLHCRLGNAAAVVFAIMGLASLTLLSACGNKPSSNLKTETDVTTIETDKQSTTPNTETEVIIKETNYFPAIDRYLVDVVGKLYAEGELCVPIHPIVTVDERNGEDILVWGDFWVFNYNQVGDTLKCVSGGNHPGLMHIRQTENGFEVTGFDQVEDGSRYLPSAKKIFGKKYNTFHTINSDAEARERLRAEGLAVYAKKHNLSVTMYQDYGWQAKKLPSVHL